jgi:site-specific recombinase XerD
MISELFVCPKTIERLETGPLAKEIRSLAEDLTRQGYTRKSIRSYLTMCDLLGRWLARNNTPLDEFCDDTIERFASAPPEQRGGTRKNWRGAVLSSARVLLRHLRTSGAIKLVTPDQSSFGDAHRWLASFDHYLDQVKGLKAETRQVYKMYASRFLEERENNGRIDWSLVTAEALGVHARLQAQMRPGCRLPMVTAMRSLLRFLVAQNILPAGIEKAIPITRRWTHQHLPERLTAEEIDRLLEVSRSDTTPMGLRNHAIMLLMTRLGIRANEAIQLRLDDIDWKLGVLLIRCGKQRERALPLPKDVAEALLAYLLTGRPKTEHREVFINHKAPYGLLVRSCVASWVVSKLFAKTGIHRPFGKAHLLRHTFASQLVNSGVSFKDTADFLGHRFLQTTGIYAKLDLDSLSQIALPWPGGVQ